MRVLLEGRLGSVRIPLQVDVGFGDAIVPAPEELEFPTPLEFPAPKLNAYSKASVVAEKFEAIVKLGLANSRMKDFYDLSVLAQRFEFENATLAAAIQATFETRRTPLPSSLPLAFSRDFRQLPNKQTQWKAFLRKSGLNANSSLEDAASLGATTSGLVGVRQRSAIPISLFASPGPSLFEERSGK